MKLTRHDGLTAKLLGEHVICRMALLGARSSVLDVRAGLLRQLAAKLLDPAVGPGEALAWLNRRAKPAVASSTFYRFVNDFNRTAIEVQNIILAGVGAGTVGVDPTVVLTDNSAEGSAERRGFPRRDPV